MASPHSANDRDDATVGMDTLLSVLQGYSTTSEVKYFIDEALDKFVQKRLRHVVEEVLASETAGASTATRGDGVEEGDEPGATAPCEGEHATSSTNAGRAPASPLVTSPSKPKAADPVDVDWLAMVVRARLETDLAQQTQLLVREEVARQVREVMATGGHAPVPARPQPTSPPPSSRPPLPPLTPSPTRRSTVADVEVAEEDENDQRPSSPPPPPRLFRGLEDDEEDEEAEGSNGKDKVGSSATTASAAPTEDAGRKQRERILGAIHDVEHQLNGLQRQVNELAHQQRLGQQRMSTFCAAALAHTAEGPKTKAGDAPPFAGAPAITTTTTTTTITSSKEATVEEGAPTSSLPGRLSTFYATLLQALDARELPTVRAMAREAAAGLLPSPLTVVRPLSPPSPSQPSQPSLDPLALVTSSRSLSLESPAPTPTARLTALATAAAKTAPSGTGTPFGMELLSVSAATSATRTEAPAAAAGAKQKRGSHSRSPPTTVLVAPEVGAGTEEGDSRLSTRHASALSSAMDKEEARSPAASTRRGPSVGVVANDSYGGDTVAPPAPHLQTSLTPVATREGRGAAIAAVRPVDHDAWRTNDAVAAQLFKVSSDSHSSSTSGGDGTHRLLQGPATPPVAAAARQLAHLLSGHNSNNSSTITTTAGAAPPHTPVERSLAHNISRSQMSTYSALLEDSPPPITGNTRKATASRSWADGGTNMHLYMTRHADASGGGTLTRTSPRRHRSQAPQTVHPATPVSSAASTPTPVRDGASKAVTHTALTGRTTPPPVKMRSPGTSSLAAAGAATAAAGQPFRSGEGSARRTVGSPRPAAGADLTLGVDAIDLPAGVLPSALGLRGGVRVLAVGRGQLAERSGVVAGDVIIAVAGRVVETCTQLQRTLRDAVASGQTSTQPIRIELYRHAANLVFTVSLAL